MIHKWSILENNSNRGWCLGWCFFVDVWVDPPQLVLCFLDLFGCFWHCCVHKNICVIWRPHPLPTAKASRSCACGALRSAPGRRHWAMSNMGLTVDREFMLLLVLFSFGGVKMSKVSPFFEVNDLEPTRVFFAWSCSSLSSIVHPSRTFIPQSRWTNGCHSSCIKSRVTPAERIEQYFQDGMDMHRSCFPHHLFQLFSMCFLGALDVSIRKQLGLEHS